MKNENKIKDILRTSLESATDKISDLKDEAFTAIWGDETVNCMVEAAFSVYHATMEGQAHSINEGYTKLE